MKSANACSTPEDRWLSAIMCLVITAIVVGTSSCATMPVKSAPACERHCHSVLVEQVNAIATTTPERGHAARVGCAEGCALCCANRAVTLAEDPARAATMAAKACERGSPRGCTLLAGLAAEGKGMPSDASRAVALAKTACEGGDLVGCILRARDELNAGATESAVRHLTAGCDGGEGQACSVLGVLIEQGRVPPPDSTKGRTWFGRACELDHAQGCARLAADYAADGGSTANEGLANEAFAKACRLGHGDSCEASCTRGNARSCSELGGAFQAGTGRPPDPVRAVALYEKACSGGETFGCLNLAMLVEDGTGTSKDAPRAAALFRRSCESGVGKACVRLAKLLEQGAPGETSLPEALVLYQRGCAVDKMACLMLAEFHDKAGDKRAAATVLDSACTRGVHLACGGLGVRLLAGDGLEVDLVRAAATFQRGCELGSGVSCGTLAAMVQGGHGAQKDETRADELLRRACAIEGGEPCFDLGRAYAEGRGVMKDERRSRELMAWACEDGHQPACGENPAPPLPPEN